MPKWRDRNAPIVRVRINIRMCICIYIYVYTYREREEREVCEVRCANVYRPEFSPTTGRGAACSPWLADRDLEPATAVLSESMAREVGRCTWYLDAGIDRLV